MKRIIYLLLLFPFICFGQAPQGVNYQAVAYDANGFELSNKEVGVRISIVEGSAFGMPQLVEEHDVITTEQGLFSIIIGQGALLGGEVASLLDIPWGSNTYFLKIELDIENNGSYMDFGTQQFMSVPYALYAESSGTPGPEGPEGEPGNHGLNCWDVNSNGLNDVEEDTNNDGEYNALDCMWVLSNSSSSPLGVILPYAASTAPEGWMICDGSEISRDQYSDLFSLIDTTYGSGNGSTSFNIPNLSGRVPVGKDTDGNIVSNAVSLGNIGGNDTHTLIEEELPFSTLLIPIVQGSNSNGNLTGFTYNDEGFNGSSFSFESNGNDQPHNNMQPYLVTNYIIRVVDEVNPNIDGVSQIPPLEEINSLQSSFDVLQEQINNLDSILSLMIESSSVVNVNFEIIEDLIVDLNSSTVSFSGIIYPNGVQILERGFCFSSSTIDPVIEDGFVILGSGTGEFSTSFNLNNLDSLINIRAYVTTENGISYSEVLSFVKPEYYPGREYDDGVIYFVDESGMHGKILYKYHQSSNWNGALSTAENMSNENITWYVPSVSDLETISNFLNNINLDHIISFDIPINHYYWSSQNFTTGGVCGKYPRAYHLFDQTTNDYCQTNSFKFTLCRDF